MKKLKWCFLFVSLAGSFLLYAEQPVKRFLLTPTVGASCICFTSDGTAVAGIGPSASLKAEYRLSSSISLGARVGAFFFFDRTTVLNSPLFNATLGWQITKDFYICIELPVIPSIAFNYKQHELFFSWLPMNTLSGGSSIFGLGYGYQFQL